METRIHRADEAQVLASRGPAMMYIIGPVQSVVADYELLLVHALELYDEFGELGVCVMFNHGTKPPPPRDLRRIVEISNECKHRGPAVGVLLGLRPVTQALFRAVIVSAKALGFEVPVETQLEAAARFMARGLTEVTVDDVMRLHEDGARRMLIRPGAGRSGGWFRSR